jgi:hypothetical protein
MSDTTLTSGRFSEGEFRIGSALSRTASVLSRNFLKFTLVTFIATVVPYVVQMLGGPVNPANPFANTGLFSLGTLLTFLLSLLSQAIVVHGAFQDMLGKPVNLGECFRVGLSRVLPILVLGFLIGLGLIVSLIPGGVLVGFGIIRSGLLVAGGIVLAIVPAATLYLMWFVAIPVLVVEGWGPISSLGRSRYLTKGHRWKIFGMLLCLFIPVIIVAALVVAVIASLGLGSALPTAAAFGRYVTVAGIANVIWESIWAAFFAILVVVTYHDLRVAKEGVGTEQIASVFE